MVSGGTLPAFSKISGGNNTRVSMALLGIFISIVYVKVKYNYNDI
jgi:hypothetical protein